MRLHKRCEESPFLQAHANNTYYSYQLIFDPLFYISTDGILSQPSQKGIQIDIREHILSAQNIYFTFQVYDLTTQL